MHLTPKAILAALALAGCADEGLDTAADAAAACAPGEICHYAGQPGMALLGAEGEPASESGLYLPQDLAFRPDDGQPYILDWNNHRVRTVDPDGTARTVAGARVQGDRPEGPALEAQFNHPTNVDFDSQGRMAIAAWHNSRIELVDLDAGTLEFIAGNGERSYAGDDGPATEAVLDLPSSVAYDDQDRLFISDQANQIIRMIDTDGMISTVAGQQRDPGYAGDGGAAAEAQLHASVGQAADPSSRLIHHEGAIWLVDTENNRVRVIDLDDMSIDLYAGDGAAAYAGDGGDRLAASFNKPRDLAFGLDGALYIADTDNSCVRVIQPDGLVETFAGRCGEIGYEGDQGPADEALLYKPYGVAVDLHGDVYIADTYNHVIRVVTPE